MQRAARPAVHGAGGRVGEERTGPRGRPRLRSGGVPRRAGGGGGCRRGGPVRSCVTPGRRARKAGSCSSGRGRPASQRRRPPPRAKARLPWRRAPHRTGPSPPFERYRPLLERNPFAPRLPKKAAAAPRSCWDLCPPVTPQNPPEKKTPEKKPDAPKPPEPPDPLKDWVYNGTRRHWRRRLCRG